MAGCAHVVVDTEIELLESRMLNPRKIFTRCKLVTHLAGCRKVCLTISSDAETDPALLVEKRCCGQTVSLLRQVAEKDLTFSETMSLSLGREGAAELLHCRANGIVTETKAIGNKLIFKGVFLVSVLYRTTGGQLASASAELPFHRSWRRIARRKIPRCPCACGSPGRIFRSTAPMTRAANCP